MFYWITNFLHAVSHYGTAYAVNEWYFAPLDPESHHRRVSEGGHSCCDCRLSIRSVFNGLAFHSGSFAFGAFVVSLAKVAWLVLQLATAKDSTTGNPVTVVILKISSCLAGCAERFLDFVSENAYVEVALRDMSFCDAARSALAMAMSRPVLFMFVTRVSVFVRLLGISVVTAFTTLLVGMLLSWHAPSGLQSINAPIVVAFVVSLLTAEVMMHPFTVAARAALHCYCIDHERSSALGLAVATHTPLQMQKLVEEHENAEHQHRCCCC
eukprot:NODE_4347_length_1903_cov_6.341779.p3 GENE.NODE_4347_length_1903_cov_6.341779~~NODE_4347_length_1903_cov_6.341779.p3  ORF type:complete len:268 (+),score=71.91 NODE_4347_length_1903_cov_6.341779:861-1664(+)